MRTLYVASLALMFALPAAAQDLANADAIKAAVSGNTVQGSMTASGSYSEFYAVDGAIKGQNYTGTWTLDANKMCFTYGTDPSTCFGVRIAGDQITWVGVSGDEGTGTILPGNPNNW